MTEKLKPCPFCGGETLEAGLDFHRVAKGYVICNDCETKTNFLFEDSITPATLVAAWNRRAKDVYEV